MDILEGERNRREVNSEGWEYNGELKKMGRQTSLWLTRYYVIKDHTLFIFQSKSEKFPKRKNSFLNPFRYHLPAWTLFRKN